VALAVDAKLKPAEQGLLWLLMHRPIEGLAAVGQLEADDLEGLLSAPVLRMASTLVDMPPDVFPGLLRDRLSEGERVLVDRAAVHEAPIATAIGCVNALRRLRLLRERAAVQTEIDRLSGAGAGSPEGSDAPLSALWERKQELVRKIEALDEIPERGKETGFVH
jgi:hypothetical protein